jgi:hypothetical protein
VLFSKQTSNHIFTKLQSAPLFVGSYMDKVCASIKNDVRKGTDYQMNNPFASLRNENIERVKEIKCVFV